MAAVLLTPAAHIVESPVIAPATCKVELPDAVIAAELLTRRADGASELQRPDAPFWGQAHDGARRPPPGMPSLKKYVDDIRAEPMTGTEMCEHLPSRMASLNDSQLAGMRRGQFERCVAESEQLCVAPYCAPPAAAARPSSDADIDASDGTESDPFAAAAAVARRL